MLSHEIWIHMWNFVQTWDGFVFDVQNDKIVT